jgi:hypothetical protein
MGRPYGKVKRKSAKKPRKAAGDSAALKIRIRGKDGAALTMQEIRDGLFEAARRLQPFEGTHRAAWATLYLTMIDEDGRDALPDGRDEWIVHPYKSAADEYE